jgi:hypothetical protein
VAPYVVAVDHPGVARGIEAMTGWKLGRESPTGLHFAIHSETETSPMTRRIDAVALATGAGFAGLTDLACRRFPRQRAAGISAGQSRIPGWYPAA